MDASALITKLVSLAEGLGIEVRFDRMEEQKGGLFKLRGKQVILVNEALPEEEKAAILAGSLSAFDLSAVYVLPEVRNFIEKSREQAD